MPTNYREALGEIDIYLFDQILKGRFDHYQTILDAGCGNGRNLVYFLQNNYDVYGIDADPTAISEVKYLAAKLSPGTPQENFKVAKLEHMPFKNEMFDVIICSAVLHFATDPTHFEKMLFACWNTLKPNGIFFARLASNIGIEKLVTHLGDGRYLLPDGSERYLIDLEKILHYTRLLNGQLTDPIKTTNVQNLRCMTTWCMIKL